MPTSVPPCPPRRDWALWIVGGLLALLVALPVLWGAWRARHSGLFFLALPPLNRGDQPFYLSYIAQGAGGAWRFANPMMAGVGHPVFNWFWGGLGWATGRFSADPAVAFHVARTLLAVPVTMAAWWFTGQVLSHRRERQWALALILIGGGLGGWLDIVKADFPSSDLQMAEFTAFGSMLTSPHLVMSWLLFLFTVPLTIRAIGDCSARLGWSAGGLAAAWFQFHPFYAPFLYTLIGVLVVWEWRRGGALTDRMAIAARIVGVSSLPVIGHAFVVLGANREWMLDANALPAESVLALLVAMAGVLLLAPTGYRRLAARTQNAEARGHPRIRSEHLLIWGSVQLAVAFLPLGFERRLLQGVIVPFALFAAVALAEAMPPRVPARFAQGTRVALFVVLFLGTPIRQWWWSIQGVQSPHANLQFLPGRYHGLLAWMRQHLGDRGTLLADPDVAPLFVGWGHARVYVASHWTRPRTERVRASEVRAIYAERDPERIRTWVRTHGITAVHVGKWERAYGGVIEHVDFLRPAYRDGESVVLVPR